MLSTNEFCANASFRDVNHLKIANITKANEARTALIPGRTEEWCNFALKRNGYIHTPDKGVVGVGDLRWLVKMRLRQAAVVWCRAVKGRIKKPAIPYP
jgi:hypothetical protein